MYLNQILLVGGIPFSVTLPKAPESVNADLMSQDELRRKLQKGLNDAENGNVRPADASEAKQTRVPHRAQQDSKI